MFAFMENSAVMSRGLPDPTSREQIAFRLRITRQAMGYTQYQMGEFAGASSPSTTWQNYEGGIRRISIDQALALCAAVGLSTDWIYRGVIESLPGNLIEKIQVQLRLEGQQKKRRAT